MTRHYVSSEKVPGKQEVVVARQEHDLLQVALPARPPAYHIAILYCMYYMNVKSLPGFP